MALSDQPLFLFMDREGFVHHATPDGREAIHLARQNHAAWLVPEPEALDAERRVANPGVGPKLALELAGLPRLSIDDWASIPLGEAWRNIEEPFREVVRVTREGIKDVDDATSVGKGFLTANAKLEKRKAGGPAAVALGLSLVPEHSVFNPEGESKGRIQFSPPLPLLRASAARKDPETIDYVSSAPNEVAARRSVEIFDQRARSWSPASTFCVGASNECKRLCLVLSGHNQSTVQNNLAKFAKAKALLLNPASFVRVLAEAILKYAESDSYLLGGAHWRKGRGAVPGWKHGRAVTMPRSTRRFLRLNVFQDVPWELFCPSLLDAAFDVGVEVYDYTKVPGRDYPGYDLTFSFSGVNARLCDAEMKKGKRLALAFAAPAPAKSTLATRSAGGRTAAVKPHFLPVGQFLSDPALLDGRPIPIVDGDSSDIRPLDPPQCITALRFKPPRPPAKRHMPANWTPADPDLFVVRGHEVTTATIHGPKERLSPRERALFEDVARRPDAYTKTDRAAARQALKEDDKAVSQSETDYQGYYVLPEIPTLTLSEDLRTRRTLREDLPAW